jgi:hypothetical protein
VNDKNIKMAFTRSYLELPKHKIIKKIGTVIHSKATKKTKRLVHVKTTSNPNSSPISTRRNVTKSKIKYTPARALTPTTHVLSNKNAKLNSSATKFIRPKTRAGYVKLPSGVTPG